MRSCVHNECYVCSSECQCVLARNEYVECTCGTTYLLPREGCCGSIHNHYVVVWARGYPGMSTLYSCGSTEEWVQPCTLEEEVALDSSS